MNPNIKKVLISEEQIVKRCYELAAMIDKDYAQNERKVLFVALLKGSVPFLSELMKRIEMDIEIDFMDVSSYDGTESIGDIKINKDLNTSIKGIDIVLVEDIVDTGRTLSTVKKMLMNKGANSVKIVTLLDKPSRRIVDIKADYIGFEVENEFVVGFGLDFNQKYRNLPYVGVLKEECYQ
ncbi:MAG: hypoxanthine phosphoribosyltransferase [Erysipelotrichaceae bacterium]|nr:hypoxanthine phosphoribosyltransferase [Erysipelotrichaceae bacterium]MDY5252790.1 hypoxanthine phosphoribosyltransferase [Erysipelotrichaceae bacterium]